MDGWQMVLLIVVATIVLLIAAIRGVLRGRRVPTKAKLAVAGAVLWLLSPLDILPDTLFPVGFLDDIAVLVAAVRYVLDQLEPAAPANPVQRRVRDRRAIDVQNWRIADDPDADGR
jgi:uncharacterized membrane protein YkvA (DUF1232 family)